MVRGITFVWLYCWQSSAAKGSDLVGVSRTRGTGEEEGWERCSGYLEKTPSHISYKMFVK